MAISIRLVHVHLVHYSDQQLEKWVNYMGSSHGEIVSYKMSCTINVILFVHTS